MHMRPSMDPPEKMKESIKWKDPAVDQLNLSFASPLPDIPQQSWPVSLLTAVSDTVRLNFEVVQQLSYYKVPITRTYNTFLYNNPETINVSSFGAVVLNIGNSRQHKLIILCAVCIAMTTKKVRFYVT
jgi:hypothetical protein